MIVATQIDNPFPGLCSFESHQADLFFGRDEQIEELADTLQEHHFVAVVGTSGSGKSSLVRAGLIPVLTRSFGTVVNSRWRIAVLRPGRNPTVELASALRRSFPESEQETVLADLRSSSAGLARFAFAGLGEGESLLLVVDQFEELFRYREETNATGQMDESAAFVKLLLGASGHSDHPLPGFDDLRVYVVITMRSDFLGKCSLFRGLPEALNECQYLVPRLTREQQREVIEGPIGMFGARIAPALVQRLLNDVGEDPDQLPVLQHALMRTWEQASDSRARDEEIEVSDYDTVGGMSEALNRDADLAFAKLQSEKRSKEIARVLFQRLVEPGAVEGETRRPTPLSDIVAVTEDEDVKVRQVIQVFCDRGFLTISADEDPIIDISHESLIRNWKQLGRWVDQESKSAATYRRLVEAEEAYELHGRAEDWLLRDPQLQVTLDWREETQCNQVWSRRYESGFVEAMAFLNQSRAARAKSRAAHAEEIALAEEQTRRELRRARWTAVTLGSLFIVAVGALIVAWIFLDRATTERDKSGRLLYDANVYFAQRAIADGQFQLAQDLLDEILDPSLRQLRGFEWFELWRVVHADEATLTGHSGAVYALAFSPDGMTLATGSADRTVKLWGSASHNTSATLAGHSDGVWAVAFSPDGKMLATASFDKTVKLRDTLRYQELATLRGHSDGVNAVAFSPDSKTLATCSTDKTIKLWDTASHRQLATLRGHSGSVYAVVFSPDGRMLATASRDKTVKLWDTGSRKEVATLAGHAEPVWAVVFSPDGKTLGSGSSDATVKLWDTTSRKELATLKGHSDTVNAVAFSPDGKTLASGSRDKTVKLWDTGSHQELATLNGHSAAVMTVAFSPDGKTIASGGIDKSVKLWVTPTRTALLGHSEPVYAVAFSPDGKILATGSGDKTVKLWDTASYQELATLRNHSEPVYAVAFSPDGKMLATGSGDKTVKLWDTASYQELATLRGHAEPVYAVAFSPDSKMLATSSEDNTVKLWDTTSHREVATLRGHSGMVLVAFSPDGKTLATSSDDKSVTLWDTASHQEVATLTGHSEAVWAVAFSPNGKTLATGSTDKTVKLWDTASHKEVATLRGHLGAVWGVTFSPDGKTLATSSDDKTVKLWDTASHKELATLRGHSDAVWAAAFSSDGKTLASSSNDKTVKLWFAASDGEVSDWRSRTSPK